MAPHVRRSLVWSVVCLTGFLAVVGLWKWLPGTAVLDQFVSEWLNDHARTSPHAVRFFLRVTFLGTSRFLAGLTVLVVVGLLLRGRWQLAAGWAITQIVSLVVIEHTKLFFARMRPEYNGAFTLEDSYSFPSGHALGSMVAFGMLAYLLGIALPAHRRCFRIAAGVVIALIGFSRIYLGVHFLSDVLAGYLLGAGWLMFMVALIEDIRGHY